MRGFLALLLVPFALLPVPAHAGVAVVELFTSEGCSSCPPAERILSDLAAEARTSHKPVYALEFHVDYWNSLGWRDPFSEAAYSERQRAYAAALGEEQVYTPQMIVNGTNAFVGSNRARADAAIASALKGVARVELTIARTGDRVDFRAPGAPRGARLCVAIVAPRQVVKVARGENAGRTLAHSRVVRAFATQELDGRGSGSLRLPRVVPKGGGVVAFIQSGSSGEVLGATSLAH